VVAVAVAANAAACLAGDVEAMHSGMATELLLVAQV